MGLRLNCNLINSKREWRLHMRMHTLRNVNKHKCHSKVDVKKGKKKKKGRFPCANSWQDDFSSPLCSVQASTVSCCSVQAGKMFICPVSQNAANLGRNLAQLFFLSLVFLMGFQTPSSCWTARSNLKVKKLALHVFSLSPSAPSACQSASLVSLLPPSLT